MQNEIGLDSILHWFVIVELLYLLVECNFNSLTELGKSNTISQEKRQGENNFYLNWKFQINIPDEASELFRYDLQRQFVVFCGTEVMQAKAQIGDYCKAIVIRTGDELTL